MPLTKITTDNIDFSSNLTFTNVSSISVETLSVTGNASFNSNTAVTLPVGTTGQRPTGAAGMLRYNANTGKFEGYGSSWGNIGGGAATGDTPPANPGAGDLWWSSADGRMYVYYADANTSQWVDISAAGAGQYLSLLGGNVSGNVAIAGNFTVTGSQGSVAITSTSNTNPNIALNAPGLSTSYVFVDKAGAGQLVAENAQGHIWSTSGTERMRIDSNGQVAFGTSNTNPINTVYKTLSLVGSYGGYVYLTDTSNTTIGAISTDNTAGGNALFIDTRTSSPIVFRTTSGTIERMRIDSSGRVTTPYQPRYSGYRTTGTGWIGSASIVPWIANNPYINVGNHYNTSTGVFTCPVAGYYRIFFGALVGNVGYATLYYIKNGSASVGLGHGNANGGSHWYVVSFEVIVYCAANDTISAGYNTSGGGGAYIYGDTYNSVVIELVG